MVNRSYKIGYNFERRIRLWLEKLGYFVIRSGKSKFPDGHAAGKFMPTPQFIFPQFYFECKVNKYLDKEEKQRGLEIKEKTGLPFVVFYRKNRKILYYIL